METALQVEHSIKSGSKHSRLDYLDVLRGIAIALVLTQHIGEHTSHLIRDFTFSRLQFGQMGVAVFFICSGFIIPVSLERAKSLKKFWIARVFRLYPMYWAALALFFVGLKLDIFHSDYPLHFSNWFVNSTMLQEFFGFKHILGLTWTLHWEMVFYFSVTALFIIRMLKYPVFLCLSLNAAFIIGSFLIDDFTNAKALPPQWIALAMMYHGTVYNKWVEEKISKLWLCFCVATTALAVGVVFYTNMGLDGDLSEPKTGTGSFPVMFTTYLLAMFIFGLIVYMGKNEIKIPFKTWLAKLGVISYSLYLIHALVLEVFDFGSNEPIEVFEAILDVSVSLILAGITYRIIEQPAINLGRKVVRAIDPSRRKSREVKEAERLEEQTAF